MYYEAYFNLELTPFSLSPDPRFVFMTAQYREALAHLLYGVNSHGGFVMLTGEIGAGKTTICQCLLEQLPEKADVAYIVNPKLPPAEFLETFCDELGIEYEIERRSLKYFTDLIGGFLLQNHSRGRNTVLIVDEAQSLSPELIEHLRLLTNLETYEKKLLQIILIGQPELRDKIDDPRMRQMAQRITARFHLNPLDRSEISYYVKYRLKVAGAKRPLFTDTALKQLWRYSGGVPRLVNIICDRALMGACVSKQREVTAAVVRQAAVEVLGKNQLPRPIPYRMMAQSASLVIAGALGFYGITQLLDHSEENAGAVTETVASQGPSVAFVQPVPEMPDPVLERSGIQSEIAVGSDSTDDAEKSRDVETTNRLLKTTPAAEMAETFVIPAGISPAESETQAVRYLMDIWDVESFPETTREACSLIVSSGLACLADRGSLQQVVNLDRPAIIVLYDHLGIGYSAVMEQYHQGAVTVILGGVSTVVSEAELLKWWYGEYLVVWDRPEDYSSPLLKSSRGSAVLWLKEALNDPDPSDVFGLELEKKVKAYQREQGLIPDGIVGPQTIIAINNDRTGFGPRLVVKGLE